MKPGPSSAEKIRRLPFVMAYDATNTVFCQLSVFGATFTLFLNQLGMSNDKIGMIMSLVPFASVGGIFFAPIAARLGVKRAFIIGWGMRNVFAAAIIFSPWIYWRWGDGGTFAFIVAMMAMFSLWRSLGEAADTQWRLEIIPHAIRGRFVAISKVVCTLAGIAALGVAGAVMSGSTSIFRFLWLMGAGSVMGVVSLIFAGLMPGGAEAPKKNRAPSFHLRRMGKVIRDRNFLLYLGALSLVGFGSAPLGVFVPLYLKHEVGMSDSTIVLVQNGALVGTLVSSYLWGWAADRFGSKPVILSALCMLLVPPLGWLAIPHGGTWAVVIASTIFLVAGVASVGYLLGTSRQLYVTIVPERRKTHYMSIFCAWMGASNGLGQLLAGQSMGLAKNVNGHVLGVEVSPYTLLFLFSILMLIVGLLLQRNVQADGSIPAGRFVGMFLQGNPFMAMESLVRYSRASTDSDRVRIIRRLGSSKSPLSADELIDALADPSFNVRYEAVVAIARSRPSARLTAELIEILISGQPELSIEAAWALGRVGDQAAVGPLRWTFSTGGPLLRLRSARALAAMEDYSIIPELQKRIDVEADLMLRKAYAATLQSLRRRQERGLPSAGAVLPSRRAPGVKGLLAALADPDFHVRCEAIFLASHREPEETLSAAIVRILEDGESDLRIEAALALGRMKEPAGTEALLQGFEGGSTILQARCARALAALGERSIVPELRRRMASQEEVGIRIAYASALGELRARAAADEIFALLDALPHEGWAPELHLALARLVDEDLFIRLWRKVRSEPASGAERFLHGSLKKAQKRLGESHAFCQALGYGLQALAHGDVDAGGQCVADAMESLPADGLDKTLVSIRRQSAARLRRGGRGMPERLSLAIACLQSSLNR